MMESEKMVSSEKITVSNISSEGARGGDYPSVAYAKGGESIIHIIGNMDYAGRGGDGIDSQKKQSPAGFRTRVNAAQNKFMAELNEFVSEMNAIIKEATSCECESDSE